MHKIFANDPMTIFYNHNTKKNNYGMEWIYRAIEKENHTNENEHTMINPFDLNVLFSVE